MTVISNASDSLKQFQTLVIKVNNLPWTSLELKIFTVEWAPVSTRMLWLPSMVFFVGYWLDTCISGDGDESSFCDSVQKKKNMKI